MCAACGIPGHIAVLGDEPPGARAAAVAPGGRSASPSGGAKPPAAAPTRFAALRNRDCRFYLVGGMLAMMADNIEHVITYWVLWQTFHSPALAGFAVIAHWLPFLLFSMYFGGLADRHDCRRVIQCAQGLFMLVSLTWGILFLADQLRMWQACVLLVVHGMAGALWTPAEQMMLHDFVGEHDLPSAVRLNATFRSLGILFGPVVGSALLLGLGATAGIFVNVLIYLPLTLFLIRTPFTGHTRDAGPPRGRLSVGEAMRVIRRMSSNRRFLSMLILGGLGSFFIGAAMQSAMPIFADSLGAGDSGLAYGVLLFATGAGGVLGGFFLEATGILSPTVRTAVASTFVFGLAMLGFAISGSYPVSVALLLVAGFANLASMSIGQTIVQLEAPAAERGRVIGVYGMSANGLRTGSGFTVGLAGSAIGVHWSLGLSATALCVGTAAAAVIARPAARAPAAPAPPR